MCTNISECTGRGRCERLLSDRRIHHIRLCVVWMSLGGSSEKGELHVRAKQSENVDCVSVGNLSSISSQQAELKALLSSHVKRTHSSDHLGGVWPHYDLGRVRYRVECHVGLQPRHSE